jgi:tetratricopeptide (TPR) repeat protein
MKNCPACKLSYDDTKNFCRKCGTALVQDISVDPQVIAKQQIFKVRIAKEPGNVELLREYGDFLAQTGGNEEALVQFYSILEIDPTDNSTRRKIAEIYKKTKNLQKAAEQLLHIARSKPEDLDVQEELVGVYIALGNKMGADALLAQMILVAPENLHYLTRRRDLLLELGKTEDMELVCNRIIEMNPNDLPSWNFLSQYYQDKGMREKAVRAYENIVRIDPNNVPAYYHLGIARHNAARESGWEPKLLSDAAKFLRKAIDGASSLTDAQAQNASVYHAFTEMKLGNVSVALAKTLKNIDHRSLEPECASLLADCLITVSAVELADNQPDEAIRSLNQAIQVKDSPLARKRLAQAHTSLGDAQLKAGNRAQALQEYETGLRFNPEDKELRNKLGQTQSLQRSRKKTLFLAAAVGGLAILTVAGYLTYDRLVLSKRFAGKINRALAEGRFFSPPGDNVEDIFKAKKAESPDSAEVKEAEAVIRSRFMQEGDAAFIRLYEDSNDDGWGNVVRIYGFLHDLVPEDRDIEARAEFSKGHMLIKERTRKNYVDAMGCYQKALKLKPNWVLAINGVAKLYVRKDSPYYNKAEALNHYFRAAEADGNFPWSYTNIAAIYAEDKQWGLAEQSLRRALSIKNNDSSIFADLGTACEKQGRNMDAAYFYQEALKYEKKPEKVIWLQKKIEATRKSVSPS